MHSAREIELSLSTNKVVEGGSESKEWVQSRWEVGVRCGAVWIMYLVVRGWCFGVRSRRGRRSRIKRAQVELLRFTRLSRLATLHNRGESRKVNGTHCRVTTTE